MLFLQRRKQACEEGGVSTNIVVIGGTLSPAATRVATEIGMRLVATAAYPPPMQLIEVANEASADAFILRLGQIPGEVIAGVPTLSVIAKHGVGVDGIDLVAAHERDIPVLVAGGANAQSVAEQALALLLAVARSTPWLDSRIRQGHWDKAGYTGLELTGRSVGLIGLGAIGKAFLNLLAPFRMPVGIYDPYLAEHALPAGATKYDTLAALLEASDVVSLHCPLTAENRGFIDADAFGRMRNDAILINTARGGLIDEAALTDALQEGRIAGAGIDTFAQEPPPTDSPLWELERLVVSPHVGANTQAARDRVGISVVEQIADHLSRASARAHQNEGAQKLSA